MVIVDARTPLLATRILEERAQRLKEGLKSKGVVEVNPTSDPHWNSEFASSLGPSRTARPAARMSALSPSARTRSPRTASTGRGRVLLGVCATASRHGIQTIQTTAQTPTASPSTGHASPSSGSDHGAVERCTILQVESLLVGGCVRTVSHRGDVSNSTPLHPLAIPASPRQRSHGGARSTLSHTEGSVW